MRLFFIGLVFVSLLPGPVLAGSLPESVSAALKRSRIPLDSVGIVVQEVHESKPIIRLNADRAMNPASTMKLLTTFAALETLGPAYRWKTEAYLNGKLENGVLQGDLVFKGYGDPKLTVEQFWMWLRELRQRGLREIRGDIVLDHSFFEAISSDPAEFDNDPTRAYNVGTSALLLNFNAMHLHLVPDGKTTIALVEPELAGYTVLNRITTSNHLRCGGDDATRHVWMSTTSYWKEAFPLIVAKLIITFRCYHMTNTFWPYSPRCGNNSVALCMAGCVPEPRLSIKSHMPNMFPRHYRK